MPVFGMPSHIDLSVSDAEASARWYCDVLGLKRLRRADLDNRVMIVLVHEATGLIIGLIGHSDVPVAQFDDRNVGLDHIGFSVTERTDLDTWEKHLESLHVVHSPVEDAVNGAALVFRDPDNIQLEFWWMRRHRPKSSRDQQHGTLASHRADELGSTKETLEWKT